MKILITGAHATCAVAVVDKFLEKGITDLVYVGRKYLNVDGNRLSLEYELVTKRNITFINFVPTRLNRTLSFSNLIEILRIPASVLESFKIFRKERPQAILCFGGSIGFFISLAGWFSRISIFVHEQTLSPGITNRLIAQVSKKIFISFPQSSRFFRSDKVEVVGNPIRQQIFQIIKKPFDLKKDKKVIYITGGSQGAHAINLLIEASMDTLLKKYILIHQSGDSHYNDFERLSKRSRINYFLKKKFLDEEIGYVLNMAHLVIARSGANTIFELIALKKPAILIPLPWAAYKEQDMHAKLMSVAGVANIFDQGDEPHKFVELIDRTMRNLEDMIKNYESLKVYYKDNAASQIVEKILAQT